MIEYLTLLSRVPETNVAALAWPQGNRCAHENFQSNKLESWLSYVSDASFNSWLKVRKNPSEKS